MMQVRVEVRELPPATAGAEARAEAQAGNATTAPGRAAPDGPDGPFGRTAPDAPVTVEGVTVVPPPPPPFRDGPPESVVEMVTMIFAIMAVAFVLTSFFRALGKRWERGAQQAAALHPETSARLQRIEQAVDSIAIEVERISEAQRFTSKLLAERAAAEPARALPPHG